MHGLTSNELVVLFFALGVLLAGARLCGEAVRRLNQPTVLGELLAGLLLGPTVLGAIAPGWVAWLFPREGNVAGAPDGAPARLIFLILTPHDDDGAQVELLADMARTFRHEEIRQRAVEVNNFTEFLALVRTQPVPTL